MLSQAPSGARHNRGRVVRALVVCGLLGLALGLAPASASAQTGGCVAADSGEPTEIASLTKADTPDPVAPGGTIAYTITFSTSSTDPFLNATLVDVLPPQTTFLSFTAPAGWTTVTPFPGGTGAVTATSTGATATSGTFTLFVNVSPAAVGTIINTVTVTLRSSSTVLIQCAATATTTVQGPCERFKDKPGTDKDKCKDKDKA